MSLGDIPVQFEAGGLTGSAQAVLREIAYLLERLTRYGEAGSIDLHGLPLSPADRRWLLDQLGKGEIDISLEIGGGSRIVETAYPGVWWVAHDNEQGVRTSEFIEVTLIPDLVPAHPDDVASGLKNLKSRISDLS
jgi:hydrogenase-1 operon protein HyaF